MPKPMGCVAVQDIYSYCFSYSVSFGISIRLLGNNNYRSKSTYNHTSQALISIIDIVSSLGEDQSTPVVLSLGNR